MFYGQIETKIKLLMDKNEHGEVNLSVLLDAGKVMLSGKSIAISSFLKKQREQKLYQQQAKPKYLEKNFNKKRTRIWFRSGLG